MTESIQVNIVDNPLNPPLFFVPYYKVCDCGAPVLERQENMAESPSVIMGCEYMETCYECQVVSSD